MKLTKLNNLTFGKSYDMHVHSGHWWCAASSDVPNAVRTPDGGYAVFKDLSCDVFELANGALSTQDNAVEKAIVSNLDCMVKTTPGTDKNTPFLKNETDGNLELLQKSTNKNEFLYATGQPGTGSAEALEKVINKAPEKFVGIKLHPKQLDLPADSPLYEPYMQLASKNKLPVLFHSQVAADWNTKDAQGNFIPTLIEDMSKLDASDPSKIYTLAKKYPDVPVIMGHTGAGAGALGHKKALDVILESIKNGDARLYCDISWIDFQNDLPSDNPESIVNLIKTLKQQNALDRVLFGSDVPVGMFGEKQASGFSSLSPSKIYDDMQNKIKTAIRNDSELSKDTDNIIDMIFYKNADELFFKKGWAQELTDNCINSTAKNIEKPGISKKGIVVFAGAAAILGTAAFLISKHKKNKAYINPPENKPVAGVQKLKTFAETGSNTVYHFER